MKITISEKIAEAYPDLRIGYVVVQGLNNEATLPLELLKRTELLEASIRDKFPNTEALLEHPSIDLWRGIYKSMKSKPGKYRPTVEALIRRVMKGNSLPMINSAVNSYLIAELETLIPVGGYDLSHLTGDINLRFSEGNESFVGMNGKEELTYFGEIVYADSVDILTRRWNYRDCQKSQVTENSKEVAFFAEAPTKIISTVELEKIINRISDFLTRYCQGTCKVGMLNLKKSNSIEL